MFLHQRLKSTSRTLQEARETRLIILGAYTLPDARQNKALLTTDISRPREGGNNTRICEADATSQPIEPVSHDLSGGHSTGIEPMDTGTSTGNLRQRAPTQLLNEYQYDGHTVLYEIYLCAGHNDARPQYGCKVWVVGQLKGDAKDISGKIRAKQAAALEAVTSLLLA